MKHTQMNGTEKLKIDDSGNMFIVYPELQRQEILMHRWNKKINSVMAEQVTKNGGDILEIGFGMGITSTHIQNYKINSHTIIEIHPQIYDMALNWKENRKNTSIETDVILGDWKDIIPTLDKKYDGILYDAGFGHYFLNTIKNICNQGCVVNFFKNTSFDDNFFELIPIKLTEEDMNTCPYSKQAQKYSMNNFTYNIKNVYYQNGIFKSHLK